MKTAAVEQSPSQVTTALPVWLVTAVTIALLIGFVLRLSNLGTKIFWGDEVYTAMRVSGYTQTDLAHLYDGKIHTVAEVRRLQHLDASHGIRDTVHSLVVDDPQHPPLFYVAERIWATFVGDAPSNLRLFAALVSILAFPAMYLLCEELFRDRRVSLLAVGLLAVSPFHLIYAHEAREYSLWTVTTLLCTWLVVRAVRIDTAAAWTWYAASVALTLYADLLSVYVLAAHSLWALGSLVRERRGTAVRFVLAEGIGVAAFAIWIIRIWSHWLTFTSYMSWGNFRYPLKSMAQKWIFNTGAVLFDLEYVQLKLAIIAALGIILLIAGVVTLVRCAPRSTSALLLLLGGVITLTIVVQDFRTGTYFSTIARYLTPLWLSLEISLAYSFVRWSNDRRSILRDAAEVSCVVVLLLGALSSAVNGASPAWWNNHINADTRELAAKVNEEPNPLLISAYRPDALLVLSHELRPDIHLLLVPEHLPARLPAGYDAYDLLSPTPAMEAEATAGGHFTVEGRDMFLDTNSPIEQFHQDLRKEQSAAHVKERQTPQEFLVHLTGLGANDDDLPFHKALPSRLAANSRFRPTL